MKPILIILSLVLTLQVYSQGRYNTTDLIAMNAAKAASEGDHFYDTLTNILYLGLENGLLYPITNFDEQKIDQFNLTGSTLNLSISNDGEAAKTLDLSSLDSTIYKYDGNLRSNRLVGLNSYSLTFDGTGANDVIIDSNGNVGIGDLTPDAKLDIEGGTLRLSDYNGSILGVPNRVLAIEADGDVIELNTVKSSKIFYPPAVVIDVSSLGTGITLNLHQEYTTRFGTPAVKSASAPAAIPTYTAGELYYYVTDYDTAVFANVTVNDSGLMTYDVISVPTGNCTFVNVVFVVK